ncbi:P-loop containing nucleoside triphosphate hydrolase protein [Echria macrotheca]|uniref:RNA helicase n=1 Tax=Echria macrotheca TaxID=438768 RepID=A0AAJ0BPC3_9PEZI|nr:P-loop containing nucleoside triphosphate hydrolase protein [Echria macrotheca]
MAKKFVPRQRKRKVLDRQRAQEQAQHEENDDSNALIITPGTAQEANPDEKKAQLRQELRPDGVKVSSKKAKRLEKYIESKLKKDENRELLAKLAANKIDTSLFSSSRSLGQTKETKKEALRRALKEQNAGIGSGHGDLLYEPREVAEAPSDSEVQSSRDPRTAKTAEAHPLPAVTPATVAPVSAGSGLKRPLDLDDSGRPVLAKRQKRGGVKTKLTAPVSMVMIKPPPAADSASEDEDEDEDDEWGGFSSEGEEEDQGSAQGSGESESESQSGEGSGSGSESDSEQDESDDGSEDGQEKRKERSSLFKAWAHQQRNEALGYQSVASGPIVLNVPKPANFRPRPLEEDPLPEDLQPTTNIARKSHAVVVTRDPEIQEVRFRLPVVAEEQRIMEAIHNNDVVVICGATGSGKTTQLPQFLFEAGYGAPDGPTPGMIGVTQPRRVAAVTMSKRVGQEMGDYSHTVAYQIRFEGTVDPNTAIKFMTDGVLLREVAQDLALRKYSAIIIDEAHERSVNTDILIAILSRVVKLRAELAQEDTTVKPLKLIIMSATLQVEEFTQNATLFRNPPRVIEVEGREHSVTVHFARKTHHDYVEDAFRKICRGHRKLPPGGFLVFLTGQGEIMQLSKRLKSLFGGYNAGSGPKVRISANEAPIEAEDIDFGGVDDRNVNDIDDEIEFPEHDDDDADDDDADDDDADDDDAEFQLEDEESGTGPRKMHILPLYSLLPTKEQLKVFDPPPEGSRLIILATNVAETSLTIPGIKYVFDCGRSKERRYDPVTGVQSFEIGWISKASAKQRAGRAGRTGPGHCWRLYSSAVYERDLPEFSEPEIRRMPLEGVVLQLKAMNLQKVVNFPFPTPPERDSLIKAEKLLTYLSAISSGGQVTPMGSTMSIFPLSPRFARILLVGHLHDCLHYTIALVAGLSAQEIFVPENQAVPEVEAENEEFRTTEDVMAEDRRAKLRKAFGAAHRNFCSLDDRSDAIKLLQVVGEFAHDPTESWCTSHFVRFKALRETRQLRSQITDLLRTNIPNCANLKFVDQLEAPTPKQVQALKQMVAAGFVDQVAIRAHKAPNPPEMYRKPRRAIDVPYIPLITPESEQKLDLADRLVYIHPSSVLAHLSVDECPEYIVYSYLQKAGNVDPGSEKKPKIRMHALTDVTGGQLAMLAKGTPLITYGKPIKEVKSSESADGKTREVWVIPYLRAETGGGMGWPLPARKVTQRRVAGKGWITE